MFEQTPVPSEDPLPRRPSSSESFLRAQAERITNRYDINNEPVESELSELVLKPNPSRFVHSIGLRLADGENPLRNVMDGVYEEFLRAYHADAYRYDPFDDGSLIGNEDFNRLSEANQCTVEDYFRYLQIESRGKHVKVHPTGQLAVSIALSEEPHDGAVNDDIDPA